MPPSISIYDVNEGDEFIFGGNPSFASPISQTNIKDKNIYIQGKGHRDSLCENCFLFWIYQAQENGTFSYKECVVDIEENKRIGKKGVIGTIKKIKIFNENYTTPSGDQWWKGRGIISYTPIERGVIFVNWNTLPWGGEK